MLLVSPVLIVDENVILHICEHEFFPSKTLEKGLRKKGVESRHQRDSKWQLDEKAVLWVFLSGSVGVERVLIVYYISQVNKSSMNSWGGFPWLDWQNPVNCVRVPVCAFQRHHWKGKRGCCHGKNKLWTSVLSPQSSVAEIRSELLTLWGE